MVCFMGRAWNLTNSYASPLFVDNAFRVGPNGCAAAKRRGAGIWLETVVPLHRPAAASAIMNWQNASKKGLWRGVLVVSG